MPLIIGENKAQKLYLGEIECKKAYLGHELVFGDAKTSSLPEGYTEVAYIHLSGSCGFKTEYFVTPSKTRILMDVELDAYSSSVDEYFFGENGPYGGYQANYYYNLLRYSETKFSVILGQLSGNQKSMDVGSMSGKRVIIDFDGPGKTVSIGNFSSSITPGTQTFTSRCLYIGCYISSQTSFPGKLYSAKGYVSGVLKFDLVPCINPSGVAGLFDLVGSTFIPNSYKGTVTAGPSV